MCVCACGVAGCAKSVHAAQQAASQFGNSCDCAVGNPGWPLAAGCLMPHASCCCLLLLLLFSPFRLTSWQNASCVFCSQKEKFKTEIEIEKKKKKENKTKAGCALRVAEPHKKNNAFNNITAHGRRARGQSVCCLSLPLSLGYEIKKVPNSK